MSVERQRKSPRIDHGLFFIVTDHGRRLSHPLIQNAACLAHRALDAADRLHAHRARHADERLDVALEFAARRLQRRVVVAADGALRDASAIKDFANRNLAAYKIPREIVFVERLPRTPNGKIQRKALALPSLVEGKS